MAFNANPGDLRPLGGLPDFALAAFTRSLVRSGDGYVPSMTTSFSDGGLDPSPESGVVTVTPELFWQGRLGFNLYPSRYSVLDSLPWGAESLGSVMANLTVTNASVRAQSVTTFYSQGDVPVIPDGASGLYGIVHTTEGDWWVGYYETTTTPPECSMSIGLFGVRFDEESDWHLDALGGGGSFTYTATNDMEGAQTIAVEADKFAQCYMANKNRYLAFAWIVVPAINQDLVAEITDSDHVADVLWKLCSSGEWVATRLGGSTTHPDDPSFDVYGFAGTVTTYQLTYDDAQLGPLNVQLAGDLCLPDGFNIGPYAPPMTPLE